MTFINDGTTYFHDPQWNTDWIEVTFSDGTTELFRAFSRTMRGDRRMTCKGAVTRRIRKTGLQIAGIIEIKSSPTRIGKPDTAYRKSLDKVTPAQLADYGIITQASIIPISEAVRAKVKAMFTKVLDAVREQAETIQRNHYRTILQRCKDGIGELAGRSYSRDGNADPFFKIFPSHDAAAAKHGIISDTGTLAMRFYQGCAASQLSTLGRKLEVPQELVSCHYFHVLRKPTEINALINQWVDRDMRAMFDGFIAKNTEKLAPILKGRDVDVTGTVSGSLEGDFRFIVVGSNAAFTMRTQIVWKYLSAYGTHFWQFPTTFHAATSDKGHKIGQPSHARLITGLL